MKYVTIAGDDIDGILWAKLKRTDDNIEREFWKLNPDAALKLVNGHFPQGVVINLPSVEVDNIIEALSPWD